MPRCTNLQQLAVPKCCQQRRSGRVKRRKQYAGFTWINFICDRPWQGGMSHFSSCKDDQPGTTGRKMDLINGTLISGHHMRGHDNFHIENSMSTDRQHETNILKRLQRPFNELESLTQSTVSDSTENGAWRDPLGDLSDFDEGFEEKNCNLRMDFKNALKEALIKRSCLNHHQHWDSYLNCVPSQPNPSADEAALKASSSGREKDDETQQRRGKRKRKPKVPFDEEVPFSIRSLRRMRRLRIMRHLGLVAPPGSPFILNPSVRTIV